MSPARAARYRREHAEYLGRMRTASGRPLAPRRTRTRLAIGFLVAVAALFAVQLAFPPASTNWWNLVLFFVVLAATAGLPVALRRATNLVTDAPDDVLDELHIRLRNSYFRDAYRIFSSVAVAVLGALLLASNVPGLAERLTQATFFPITLLATFLPTVVAAFRLPDVDAGE